MKKYIIGYVLLLVIFSVELYFCRLFFAFGAMSEYSLFAKCDIEFWYRTLFIYIPIILIGLSTLGIFGNNKIRTIIIGSLIVYMIVLYVLCTW